MWIANETRWKWAVAFSMTAVVVSGCATARRSTRFTIDDLDQIALAMARSLARQSVIAHRNQDSPAWVVSIDKVRNLTSDVMTDAERWAVVAHLRGMLPLRSLEDRYNITFVIPVERRESLRAYLKEYESDDQFGRGRRPTHQMAATFRSLTRAQAHHRTEMYHCQFEMVELGTRRLIWADEFEFKRAAVGHVWD